MNSLRKRHFSSRPAARSVDPEHSVRRPPNRSRAMNKPLTMHQITAARPLAGRVSLITGSTSGIGLGIARALAAAGSAVVLNGFGKIEEITATQARLADECGVTVQYSGGDVSNPASIAEMMETTLTSLGRLDILVNNAGIQFVAP